MVSGITKSCQAARSCLVIILKNNQNVKKSEAITTGTSWILLESSNTSVFPVGTWLMMTLENLSRIALFQLGVEILTFSENNMEYTLPKLSGFYILNDIAIIIKIWLISGVIS